MRRHHAGSSTIDPGHVKPTDIPGLEFWVRADLGIVPGAPGFVSAWQDQSDNARHATQSNGANQPTFVSSWTNGKPALHFDGNINQWLENAGPWTINQPSTAIVVCHFDSSGPSISASIFDQYGPATDHHGMSCVFSVVPPTNFLAVYAGLNGCLIPSFAQNISPVYVIGTFNGLNSHSYMSNGQTAMGDAGNSSQIGITVGQGMVNDRNYPMYGYIGEIMIFNKALTEVETINMKTYLNGFWGL